MTKKTRRKFTDQEKERALEFVEEFRAYDPR